MNLYHWTTQKCCNQPRYNLRNDNMADMRNCEVETTLLSFTVTSWNDVCY